MPLKKEPNQTNLSTVFYVQSNVYITMPYILSTILSTIAWLHYLNFNETPREKVRCEQHKDAACCFEQVLEAAS